LLTGLQVMNSFLKYVTFKEIYDLWENTAILIPLMTDQAPYIHHRDKLNCLLTP
jgi:hypothetical protein